MKISNPTAKLGEEKASLYLKRNKFHILTRNFRKRYGEIDIVAIDTSLKEKALVFVEVKTRRSNSFGNPVEGITLWKLKTLIKTAEYYKMTHRNLPDTMRIDAISVSLTQNNIVEKIEHIKNISSF